MSENIIQDIATEGIAIGYIYRNIDILNEYLELIFPQYDFSDEGLRFLYNLLIETYLNHDFVNETSLNIQLSRLGEDAQKTYKNLGGFNIYQRLSNVSEVHENFSQIYEQLKVYNVLRNLDAKGFAIKPNLEKLKTKTVEQILKGFEMQLIKTGSFVNGINDSVKLGSDFLELYESFKINPDIGIKLPFPILNDILRGWRLGRLYANSMNSGLGKSRHIVYILCHTSIMFGQTSSLLMINEQDATEIKLMMLACVANNMFAPKYGVKINESEIARGSCTGVKDEILKMSAKYIKEHSQIHLLELTAWDYNSVKMIMKKHKLRGINHMALDTFKSMRGAEMNGLSDWMQFSYTAERLKSIIGSKEKGGLEIAMWLTLQQTDDALNTKALNSNSLATSKQIKHSLDTLLMNRMLDSVDKSKMQVKINMPDNIFNGQLQQLDMSKTYYLTHIDKNRSGIDKSNIIYEVNKGEMTWKELGFAVYV